VIRVEGRDVGLDAYRVSVEAGGRRLAGLVPEALLGASMDARLSHQFAHEALAARARPIRAALLALAQGRTPRAPYDAIRLRGEDQIEDDHAN
jgi:hypothetical protein